MPTDPWDQIATQTNLQVTARQQATVTAPPGASRNTAITFDEWAGTLPPQVIAAIGKYRQALTYAEIIKVAQANQKSKSSNPLKRIGNVAASGLKGLSRTVTGATIGAGEVVWNAAAGGVDIIRTGDYADAGERFKGIWSGSSLAHVFDADQGSGYFQSGKAAERREQAKAMTRGVRYITEDGRLVDYEPGTYYAPGELDYDPAKLRPVLDPVTGQPWLDPDTGMTRPQARTNTIGRLVLGDIAGMDVDDTRYKLLSGAVDGAIQIWGDPMNTVSRTTRAAREARATILPSAEFLDDAAKVRQDAGLLEGTLRVINPRKADDWLKSRQGQALVDWHTTNTSSAEAFRKLSRDVDPQVALELAGTKNADETMAVFRRHLGVDAGLTDARDLPGWLPTAMANTAAGEAVGRAWRGSAIERSLSRQGAKVWDDVLHIDKDLSREGRVKAIRQLDDMLATAKVNPEVRDKVVSDAIEGLTSGSREGQFQAVKAAYRALGESYMANGMDPVMAKALTRFDAYADDYARIYSIDALGHNDDFGMVATLAADGTLEYADITAVGPLMLSEGWQGIVDLPDYRQVKALTNAHGRLWSVGIADPENAGLVRRALAKTHVIADVDGTKIRAMLDSDNPTDWSAARDILDRVGNLRIGLAATDVLSTQLWKRAAVLRVATPLRVIGEEQARLAEAGLASSVHHPLAFLALASNHNAVGGLDILGNTWRGKALSDLTNSDAVDIMESYFHALANGKNKLLADTGYRSTRRHIRLNAAQRVYKHNATEWVDGSAQELRRMWSDPIFRLAARQMAEADYDAFALARTVMNDPEYAAAYRNLADTGKNGIDTIMRATGHPGKEIIDFTDPAALAAYLDTYVPNRIRTLTAGNADLLKVVAHGRLGEVEHAVTDTDLKVLNRVVTRIEDPAAGFGSGKLKTTWIGSTVYHPTYGQGVVTAMGTDKGTSLVKFGGSAWEDGRPTAELRKTLEKWRTDPSSPEVVKFMGNHTETMVKVGPSSLRVGDFMDKTMGWFFNGLWGRSTDYLSRSPAFRQFYYRKVGDLLPFMDPTEANLVLRNMEAAGAGRILAPDVLDRVVEQAKKAGGKFTAADIDGYAKDYALGKVKGLLYDASERSQFADALRIVFPFAEAWKEVITRQAKLIARDPGAVHTVAKVMQGARRSGMFHYDANGNEVFSYPLSEQAIGWFTGVEGVMTGRTAGLNIGFSLMPGVGPVVQIPASTILPDTPDWDWARDIITPYGERGFDALVPGWALKMKAAFDAEDGSSQSAYAVMLSEVIRVKAASGEYGTDLAGYEKLLADARHDARNLTILRALGQFTLPSSPSYDLKVTGGVDTFASALSAEFMRMRDEDPDNATENFLALYGDDLAAFVISKTRATVGGLDDSKDWVDWTRTNAGVINAYEDVAYYFAPRGGGRDSSAFQRQLDLGARVRRSPEEQAKAINTLIARRRLAEFQAPLDRQIADYEATLPPPASRSRDQEIILNNLRNDTRAELAEFKQQLATDYEGFSSSPVIDVNERERQIETLYKAADDARLKDNPTRATLAKYLDLRDRALDELAARNQDRSYAGLGANRNQDLADWLADGGRHYAAQDPGFARLWEDVLQHEVTE